MIRKIQLIGLAALALFVASVAAATSASASEWLDNGAAITTAQTVIITGSVELSDDGFGVTITCEGKGEGTVGPGAADLTTALKAEKCTSPSCAGPTVEALGLPWETELLNDEDHFTGEYEATCIFKDVCKGTVWPLVLLEASGVSFDPVHIEFQNLESEAGTCSLGGEKSALTKGLFFVEGLAGHLITVS